MKTTSPLKFSLLLLIITLFLSACSADLSQTVPEIPSPTMGIITATLPPTFTPRATSTLLPAPVTPTLTPVIGTASTQINVRSRPSTASEAVGLLNAGDEVNIIGQDSSGSWYEINFSTQNGEQNTGWVTAEYIETASKPNVPVRGGEEESDVEGFGGRVIQPVNIRSGPGTNFLAIGLLNINDLVTLTGKNDSETWLQISYPEAKDGSGWLSAAYVESNFLDDLPVLSEADLATAIPATPTPMIIAALEDGDSSAEPAISVTFSATDSRSFSYSSDVSSPEGDAEDWVAFHPNTNEGVRVELLVDLSCEGNGDLVVEMWQGGIMLTEWGQLHCGDSDYALSMYRDETYQFRLRAKPEIRLKYVSYTITVRAAP